MCWAVTDYRRKENIISKAIKTSRKFVGWCTLVLTLMPTFIVWKIWLISTASLPTRSKKRSNVLFYHNNHLFGLRMCTDYSNSRREPRTSCSSMRGKEATSFRKALFLDSRMPSSMCQLWAVKWMPRCPPSRHLLLAHFRGIKLKQVSK